MANGLANLHNAAVELDVDVEVTGILVEVQERPGSSREITAPLKPRYGFELMRRTRQPSGTLYPVLAKFEKAGWLTAGQENIDPHAAGRPPRRFYRITGAAVAAARVQLAVLSERYRPPAPTRPRLAPRGGTS